MLESIANEIALTAKVDALYPSLGDVFVNRLLRYYPPTQYFKEDYDLYGEFPIVAALVKPTTGGRYPGLSVLSLSPNRVNETTNSLNHAEKFAIEKALERLGTKHLDSDAILLSTVEPCAMCASAFVHSEGRALIFGAYQADLRGREIIVGGHYRPFRAEPLGYSAKSFSNERNPNIVVTGGYRRSEVLRMMDSFNASQSKA